MTHTKILSLLGSGSTPEQINALGVYSGDIDKAMAIIRINGFKPELNLFKRCMVSESVWLKLDERKTITIANKIRRATLRKEKLRQQKL